MPSYGTTVKHALRYLLGTSKVQDIDAGFQALAEDLDAIISVDDQGTLAGRPTSSVGTPGIVGRKYFVTGDPDSTQNGRLYRDHGTGWDEVAMAPLAKARLATDALNAFLKLAPAADLSLKYRIAVNSATTFGNTTRCNAQWPHTLGRAPVLAAVLGADVDTFTPNETATPVIVGKASWDATNVYAKCITGNGGSSNNPPSAHLLVIG
jgi:hypothetical protein